MMKMMMIIIVITQILQVIVILSIQTQEYTQDTGCFFSGHILEWLYSNSMVSPMHIQKWYVCVRG